MLIYHYHPDTGLLLGQSEADQAVFDGAAWALQLAPVPVDDNITAAPDTLFGGPTIKDVFYGNQ